LLTTGVSRPEDLGLLRDIMASVERGSRLTRQLLAYGRRLPRNPRVLVLNELLERNLPLFRRLVPATVRFETSLSSELLPFVSTKERHLGSGLGLSAVQGIVRQSGGNVIVHSELGQGTSISVRLPRSSGSGAQVASALAPAPRAPAEKNRLLLVVDDEGRVLEVTRRLLVRLGYRVLDAARPELALRLLEERQDEVALLLTDLVMPRMNGAELAAAARETRPDLPVLFMSGYDPGLVEQFGTEEILQKPFTLEQLGQAVERALGRSPRENNRSSKLSGFITTSGPAEPALKEERARRGVERPRS
jgi:CheY-like chemotaxis protein